ncbi:hypothetical protein VM1G_03686 [Cytospora mali]|uniref:AAA+ ATPase domain-containing protein n=1 Tax=Cytospora mali TaxID=578113 RepID=A0A194VY95_CYTMA|nr:hypothetical protein VM1G_03686 [Valsa mali]
MALAKESVLSSPTTESVPIDEQPTLKLKPGQYSLDTTFNVSCGNHKEKRAVLRLLGDLKIEYKEDGELSQWDQLETCELRGCNLQCELAESDAPGLFYTEALQQALSNSAGLKFKHECGHDVIPDCSACSKPSLPENSIAGDGTAARPILDVQFPGDGNVAITDASMSESSTDSGIDTPSEGTRSSEGEVEDEENANKKKHDIVPWFPYQKHRVAGPPETDGQEQLDEKSGQPEEKTAEPSEVPVDTKAELKTLENPQQDSTEEKKSGLDFTQVSESACHPVPHDGTSTQHKKRLTKEAKAQRAAALKQQREDRKKAHEEEIQDITEEIAHQREVLRSRRDQKKQRQKLRELQKKLERLCQKELDDSDYSTSEESEDEGDEANRGNSNPESSDGSSPDGEKEEESPKDEDAEPASEEKAPQAIETGEDSDKPEVEDTNTWTIPVSKAKQAWEERKNTKGEVNGHLDDMMDMIGLESVKAKMLEIKTLVETARRQDVDFNKELFHTVFKGNPGTGKTAFSRMLAGFFVSLDLVDDYLATTSGSKLVIEGVMELKKVINHLGDEKGIVIIDDAHILRPTQSSTGRKVLDYIVTEMDRLQGQVIFIFTGYGKEMETFLAHNQSLQGRIPYTIEFGDYEDIELLQILEKKLNDKFSCKMKVDKGVQGPYMRMATRRMGRGRGIPGFGNAREVENTLLRMLFRQATRLEEARKSQEETDDLFLTMEDIVGPPPSIALEKSKAWQGLQEMIGLKSVKESLKALVYRMQVNYDREIAEKPIVDCPLNRVFLGNPGTGKTTVAKYYGQIMVDIGVLSNGEVVVKNPSDLIGEYIGESEQITKAVLASTKGKVLIIDEAYGLSDKSADDKSSGNFYKTAIVDTLVANIQGTTNEDRCVLLLGYKDRMEKMFQHANPGLSRRFPMSSAFEFEDFTDEELREILESKLKTQGYTATDQAKEVAMEVLARARNHLNFGNAGEIDNLLTRAKESQQARLSKQTEEYDPFLLEREDFDSDFDRPNKAEARIKDLFKDFVGADDIVEKLVGYSRIVQNTKALEMDPRTQVPFNYLFRGPPGTGKTTTARRIGQVFYDMGLLATNQVYDCSATDLIGEYIGQTGPKTQKVFQRALGKVLFIDEAYRLNDESHGKEALIEMLNILTKKEYKNKIVTVLAGYNDDINKLLQVNPGLSSRFPEVIQFENLKPKQCVELFIQRLEDQKLDAAVVKKERVARRLQGSFERLAGLPDWGNARDIEVLAKSVFGGILLKDSSSEKPTLVVEEELLDAEVDAMVTEREKRAGNSSAVTHLYL